MSDFSEIMQDLVNQSDEFKISLAVDCLGELLPTFRSFDPEHDGMYILYTLLGTTVAADGHLTDKEYAFIASLFTALDVEADEEEIIDLCRTCAGNEDAYQMMMDVRDHLDDEGINTLANLVAAICSIDDRISSEELSYITDLLDK